MPTANYWISMQLIETSYFRNRPLQWFGIRVSTLTGTLTSCLPALAIVGILKEHPALSCFMSIGIVATTFRAMEHFRQGKYENENLEKFIVKFIKTPFNSKNLNHEDIAKSKVQDDYDWYLPNGDDLIGFKMTDCAGISFETFVSSLIPILPTYSSAKFVRPQRPDMNAPKNLREKNVSVCEYYIFVRIPMQIMGNALKRNELKEKITSLSNKNVRQMKNSEIAAVAEHIFFPFQHETKNKVPFFRSNIEISEGLASGLWPEKNVSSVSLVQLPEKYASKDFDLIYNSISNLTGAVCVTIERIEVSKIKKAYKNHFNQKHNKIEDNSLHIQTQIDSTPVKMHLGILLHGSEREISQAIFDLDMACMSLGDEFRPIFGQDLGFIKKALSVYLPGSRPLIPFRSHTVDSMKELYCYLPKPDFSSVTKDHDLVFRTASNKMLSIKQDSKFPVAYISDMGAGKSLLLSLNAITHIKKKHTEQVAGCYIEIGGSFRFLTSQGLADAYFVLRDLDGGVVSPLQDHPLKAFQAFGKKGEEAAIKWILLLCSVESYGHELLQKTEHMIAKAVSKFFESKKDSLSDFYLLLKSEVIEEYPDVVEDEEHVWRILIRNLSRYVDKKRWGSIFCPEETKDFDFENARFVYFSSYESKLEPEGIYKPFFTFAVYISQLLSEKYSSNSANPCRIQFLIDEMHILRKIIPDDLYVDLNSVARKEGKIPMFATQNFSHITLDENKWGSIKKYNMIQSVKRLWFYQFPGTELALSQFLGTNEEDPLIERIRSISISNLRLKEKGIYAWGYVDEYKKVHQLIIDTDNVTLWACTTHPGGIAIREACLKTGLYNYWKTCELLAERFPEPIPESAGIPKETIEKIVDLVIFNQKKES